MRRIVSQKIDDKKLDALSAELKRDLHKVQASREKTNFMKEEHYGRLRKLVISFYTQFNTLSKTYRAYDKQFNMFLKTEQYLLDCLNKLSSYRLGTLMHFKTDDIKDRMACIKYEDIAVILDDLLLDDLLPKNILTECKVKQPLQIWQIELQQKLIDELWSKQEAEAKEKLEEKTSKA